jgi:hypothetical protein
MRRDAIFDAPSATATAANSPTAVRKALRVAAATSAALAVCLAAWRVSRGDLYTSGSNLGYYLGLAGGSMMLILLLYPLRKHMSLLRDFGPLKYWFRIHMLLGIFGPLFVLFHSTFRIGSLNAAVALSCMVLVATSGIVGRFIYRKIHHGLYGTRATLEELQATLARQLAELEPVLNRMPQIRREVEVFVSLAEHHPSGRWASTRHFLSLGWNRVLTGWRVHRAIAAASDHAATLAEAPKSELASLVRTIDATLRALQRNAQFANYERLFALWHVLHIPFVYMLVLSAIFHVVAVHMY